MINLRVLIVDDEEHMRVVVSRALARHVLHLADVEGEIRFSTDTAGSAEEGLEKMTQSPPDLMLLDHKLPGMSGVELLSILAQRHPDLITVMMTAYATLETAVAATKRGAFDFLAKPFTPEELKSVVSKATHHLLLQREARRLANERRQLRFQFISVLVHELKAPLAAIQGYLYLLQDRAFGSDPAGYDRVIGRSLVRVEGMRKLIMDLLDLTRLESGQKKRDLTELDLRDVARTSMETVQPDAQARGITVELTAPEPVPMAADRGEMEILLNNLVTNAVKYNVDGGRVGIVIRPAPDREGHIYLEVSDTGIGMSEEECGRLFQEFVRIKNDKTRNILGSGLGLSIARKLARLYGGDIGVRSRPGEGTTFTVTLATTPPVESSESGAAPVSSSTESGAAPASPSTEADAVPASPSTKAGAAPAAESRRPDAV